MLIFLGLILLVLMGVLGFTWRATKGLIKIILIVIIIGIVIAMLNGTASQ